MSFTTKAFDLTPEDQHVMLGRIQSLLLRTNAAILQAKQKQTDDYYYHEAHRHLEEALVLATDANACDHTRAPLATCYLYKGHVHLGLGQYAAAHEAYSRAAACEPRALSDIPAAQDAARKAVEIRDWVEAEKEGKNKRPPMVRAGSGSVWGMVSGVKRWRGEDGHGKVSLAEALAAGAYEVRLPVTIHAGAEGRGEVVRMPEGIIESEQAAIIKMRAPRKTGMAPDGKKDLKTRWV